MFIKARTALIAFLVVAACATTCEAAGGENPIPVGTVISLQNWQQYRQFMPYGMQALFAGTYAWKIPADFRMLVGPLTSYPLPKAYQENTEKYSHLVAIKNLPDGRHTITGYVAGLPFPEPAEPMKGYKILVNNWYRYVPYLYCGNDSHQYLVNQAGQITGYRLVQVVRRFSHISDAGQPINDPRAQGVDFSEYSMQLEPEEDKYTEILTLYYVDPTKPEDEFIFVPKLRRVIRGSSNSRCAPVNGGDFTPDDFEGFRAGIARFQADYLKDQQVLALTNADPKVYGNLSNYYSLYFPKPEVGQWEVRDSYVIDTRRVPSLRAGYCYGKRIMWVDKYSYSTSWADIYDPEMKLVKITMSEKIAASAGPEGMQLNTGNNIETIWDIQARHLTTWLTSGSGGKGLLNQQACRNLDGVNYDDPQQYSTVGGLTQIMR
jgi:hypothetical protein